MKIKIISDSTCDLSPSIIHEKNITLVPLTVIKDETQFKDGVTITPADIFEHVASGGDLCTTSANSVGEYADLFFRFQEEYDGIFVITIGSDFSSCYQHACLAAEDFPKVRIIDSRNLSTGQALTVLKACELAETADNLDEMADTLNAFTQKVETSFVLNRLEYMVKGGRCSSVVALGANLLNLKPCIEVRDGQMIVVKKYRGNYDKCLNKYIDDRLRSRKELLDHERVFVTHTPVSDPCLRNVISHVKAYDIFDHIVNTNAGCTVSCHCGPETLGLAFVRK